MFIGGDEDVEREPGVGCDLGELIMGQNKLGGVKDGPGVVGGEGVAEGEAAKEAGGSPGFVAVGEDGVGE